MKYQWRRKAEKQVETAIRYCGKEFGKSCAEKFLKNLDHQVDLLAANPQIGPIEPLLENRRRVYRSLLIHKHYKLLYYIADAADTLYITALWDTRREPGKLSYSPAFP